jgi:hypothetical protein
MTTVSISDQPSPWRRLTDYPKRAALLADATVDPFPQRVTRSASLYEHHIVRDPHEPPCTSEENRRSNSLVPLQSFPVSGSEIPQPVETIYIHDDEPYEPDRNRLNSIMTDQASGSSSPASAGQAEGKTQFCLCQPEAKIPRPRNCK